MRGNIGWQVNQVMNQLNGIGTSKAESRAESGLKDMRGHEVSDKIHSYEYRDEVERILTELSIFAREEFDEKDLQAISAEMVQEFIKEKIESGVTFRSISNYISELSKALVGLEKLDEKYRSENKENRFTNNDLKEIREYARENAVHTESKNRAYENPNSIINNLKGDNKLVAELQLEYGLRISEASRFSEKKNIVKEKENTIKVQGKGGKMIEKTISSKHFKEITNRLEQGNGKWQIGRGEGRTNWENGKNNYRDALKESAFATNQEYTGSHGFRYNYAQDKNEELSKDNNISVKEAHEIISNELGHNREEITMHYLK